MERDRSYAILKSIAYLSRAGFGRQKSNPRYIILEKFSDISREFDTNLYNANNHYAPCERLSLAANIQY